MLDDIIFDSVGLTIGERDAVLEETAALVEARISRARSRAR
jgi:hypothetical protein